MKETLQGVVVRVHNEKSSEARRLEAGALYGAARAWVKGFNRIPYGIVEKLLEHSEELEEITPYTVRGRSTGNGYKSVLPRWNTLFSFSHPRDNEWLEDDDNVLTMANLGFRIYKQEDYGYIFGIDGVAYDLFKSYWIPLYLARGLRHYGYQI